MKEKKLILCIVILQLMFGMMHAQKPQTIEDEYAAYFTLPREALYVHLNKTTFLKGEEIWFKGYTYDQKNQLTSKATTNIYVGVYDAAGNQLKKALFKAENGVMQGNFQVDSTFSGGTYYIKASTNWMKNFKENDAFVQKIEIVSDQETVEKNETRVEKNYDFQFLPEGGHIVVNTLSNVGFKVIDENGKGVSVSGIVYNDNQKQVASFESNTLGMGKFLFQPKEGQKYTAEIKLEDGTVLTEVLPEAKDRGISMVLHNPFEDKVIINFSTNQQTLSYPQHTNYKILIHQNGNLKTIDLQLDATEKALSILKKDLFKGVNTITVFNDNGNPVLERLFFNDYFVKNVEINVSKLNTFNDSIVVSLNELKLNENANLSVSVLPEMTKSYQPQHNILSNFYLKPHVKGFIENPQYYFQDMDRKKKYELDILLLTQGWSRYEWNDIFGKKPNALNRFENGITIKGRVNRPTKEVDRIFMYATKHHSARFIELDKDKNFTITNLFLEEGEEIRFSYVDKRGIFKKPGMYLNFRVSNKSDRISQTLLNAAQTNSETSANFTIPENFIYKDSQLLDTVVLVKNTKEVYKDPILVNAKVYDFGEQEYSRFVNVTDFIQYNGYEVAENLGRVDIRTRRRPVAVPTIYFDGVRIRDFSVLYNLSSFNVERVVIDKTGVGEGVNAGFGGVIKIYTRKTPLFKNGENTNEMYVASEAPYPFKSKKTYYSPNYTSYLNPMFERYGAISWIPELKLDKNTAANFKIFDTKTRNITLYIEGISENGDLISAQKTIQVR